MNLMQDKFVSEYLKDGNAHRSAKAAGYACKSKNQASELVKKPHIQAAIAEGRKQLQIENKYDLQAAVKELDEKIKKAESANQYSAVAKMLELKMKAHGHLVEKFEVRQTGFSLVINRTKSDSEIEIVAEVQKEIDDIFS